MSESPIVISAFPGVGKTYFYNYMNSMPTETFIVWSGRDSDSSKFPKEGFPQNYVKAIKRDLRNGIQFTQLVSSHKEVRDAMACAGIDYYLVFPENHLKQVYLERYKRRGSPQAFIDLLDKNIDFLYKNIVFLHKNIVFLYKNIFFYKKIMFFYTKILFFIQKYCFFT